MGSINTRLLARLVREAVKRDEARKHGIISAYCAGELPESDAREKARELPNTESLLGTLAFLGERDADIGSSDDAELPNGADVDDIGFTIPCGSRPMYGRMILRDSDNNGTRVWGSHT